MSILIDFDSDHPASKLAPHPVLDTLFVGDGTYVWAWPLIDEAGGTREEVAR